MSSITNENVQKFKSYGFVLTPVIKSKDPSEDKKPLINEKTAYRWSNKVGYEWTDQELLDANRIGAWHEDSKIFDVDFDDRELNAHKFIDMLPPTFTIGKKVNGRTIATHLIYKTNENVKDEKKTQPLVEMLANTQTIIAGVDRLLDMFRTSVNVAGDLTIATIINNLINK